MFRGGVFVEQQSCEQLQATLAPVAATDTNVAYLGEGAGKSFAGPGTGQHQTFAAANAVRESGIPHPGSEEFAALCKSLDSRSLGYRFVKRTFDIAFSGCLTIVGFIPCAVLAIAIAADTKGTPVYSQVRVGRYGKPFHIFKFRTMVADADNVEKYLTPVQLVVWKRERKVDDDPRITRLGRVLRKTSIDELPQFINVLLGQISVIGPRPISYDELEHFGNDAALLCSVPGGITGLWQSSKRNDATFETGERQKIELRYVKEASLGLDAKCFFDTFGAMFDKITGR